MYFEKRKRGNPEKLVSNVCNLPNYLEKKVEWWFYYTWWPIRSFKTRRIFDQIMQMIRYTKALHIRFCSFKVSKIFHKDIFRIKNKFLATNSPQKFVKKVIHNFKNDEVECFEDGCSIPSELFDIAKPVIIVEVPFCAKNKVYSKQFMRKFHNFTGSKFD